MFFSYEAGKAIEDVNLCDNLFESKNPMKAKEVLQEFKKEVKANQVDVKATCPAVASVCPGVSIGCGLCGLFLPGVCGSTCIVAGLYCGVSSYACRGQ